MTAHCVRSQLRCRNENTTKLLRIFTLVSTAVSLHRIKRPEIILREFINCHVKPPFLQITFVTKYKGYVSRRTVSVHLTSRIIRKSSKPYTYVLDICYKARVFCLKACYQFGNLRPFAGSGDQPTLCPCNNSHLKLPCVLWLPSPCFSCPYLQVFPFTYCPLQSFYSSSDIVKTLHQTRHT